MAHVLSSGEKATQRLQRQWSKSHLAIPEYHVIYSARLAGVPTINDLVAEINFSDGIGTLADVLPDMTLYVGTTAGGHELGMCRIRKAPLDDCSDGTFYIAETSEIVWVDECHLTVVDDYQLWAKPLRTVSEVPYMDWDVAYSDQHADFDPVPVMGCDAVARLVNGTVDVLLGPSADTAAWVIDSTVASVLWTIDGATAIDDDTAVNPTATFTAAGTYLAYCQFTAANGKTFTGVRTIIIWDDANPLIEDFQIRGGRMDGEGCSFEVTLFNHFSKTDLRLRSKVILCTEDFANNQQITLPGQIAGRENIVCIGWITDIDTSRQSEFGEISFTVESAEFWMKRIPDYPFGLEFKTGTAAAWTDMPSLTVDRALWHFLHWRSTATRIMDVTLTDDTRMATRFNVMRSNLWERLEQVADPTIFANVGIDQFGRLFVSIEPQMVPLADRTWPEVMTIEDSDIEGDISWTRRDVKELAMLFLSGISVDETGAASSFFSMSPGHSYGHHGGEESQDNYLVASQENSNQLCGLYYGWRNNDPYDLNINFAHSMRILGIWPRQTFYYEVPDGDDPRGIGFGKAFIIREIDFEHDPDTGFISFSARMEPEAPQGPSVNGDVPTMEDIDFSMPDLDGLSFPSMPSLPYIIVPPTEEPNNQPKKVVIATSEGVFYCENFDAANVKWKGMNTGLGVNDIGTILNMVRTPAGGIYLFTQYERVFYCPGLGGSWRQILDNSQQYFEPGIHSIGVDPLSNDRVFICGLGVLGGSWGGVATASYGVITTGTGVPMRYARGASIFSAGKWLTFGSYVGVFTTPWVARTSSNGMTPEYDGSINTALGQDAALRYANVIGTGDKVIQWDNSAAGGYNIIEDGGTTINRYTGITPVGSHQAVSMSPAGVYGIAASGLLNTPYLTDDGGITWSSLGGVIPAGSDVWENCRDDYRWIFGGGIILRLTMDRGATYLEKIGNLYTMFGLVDITHIRYIE